MSDEPNDHDDVGYGRPPKRHRFVKGRSGNPAGRPKKSRNFDTMLLGELKSKVRMNVGGREKLISKDEAISKKVVNDALKGNTRMLEFLVKYMRELGVPDPLHITPVDAEELNRVLRQQALKVIPPKDGEEDEDE
jgi:hypothetical protein